MTSRELKIFRRKQTGAVVAPIKTVVSDDGIVAGFGMRHQPPPSVIDIHVHLWILEKRTHHRVLRNQLQVAGVDLHRIETLELRLICKNLRPRSSSQADDENAFWRRAESVECVGPDYNILVIYGVYVEIPVVNTPAEHISIP